MKQYLLLLLLILLLIPILFVTGCDEQMNAGQMTNEDIQWKCSSVQCAEVQNIDGTTWAQQNCQITQNGTLCQVTFSDGQQTVVPIESINLSAIKAQQCTKFTCVEEVPYRVVNYTLNVTK